MRLGDRGGQIMARAADKARRFKNQLVRIYHLIRLNYPDRRIEWFLGIVLLLWGCILQLNPDLFEAGGSYGPLADLMPQPVWAALCLGAGAARIAALLINGAYRRTPHLRALTAFIACLFWYYISIGFYQSGAFSTGLAVYPVALWFDSETVLRVAAEAARNDKKNAGRRINGMDT